MGAMTQLTVTASVMLRQAVSCRRAVQIMIDDGGRRKTDLRMEKKYRENPICDWKKTYKGGSRSSDRHMNPGCAALGEDHSGAARRKRVEGRVWTDLG
jgi:hypothetical protein